MLAAFLVLAVQAGAARKFPSESERLIETGKLWITVKYFHPFLAYRDIDWDKALIEALPKIRAAQSQADYGAAVQSLLEVLADPMTHIADAPEPPNETASLEPGQRIWIHDGLAPADNSRSSFYSAFQIKPGAEVETAALPIGSATAIVRLSEPANSAGTPAFPPRQLDREYPDAYPAAELRILAAFKIWGVFHYFFAYRDLMDEDWDELLPAFLPKIIAAKDARDYNLAIADLLSHLTDSQVAMNSAAIAAYFGEAPVGLRLRLIEKHAVVTEVLDPAAAAAGVKPGDIVKTVDGEVVVDRFKRQAQYIPSSTPQSLGYALMKRILNGEDGSTAALTIEDQSGARKQINLKRHASYSTALAKQRAGDPVRLLPGSIGYADLDRLSSEDIDPMFEKFRDAKAIVFDMRGGAQASAAQAIAARLTSESDVPAAILTGPLTIKPDVQEVNIASPSFSYFFVQTVPNSSKWKYRGKTLMLIDERTQSSAEHAGLYFEVANKSESAGTPSAGADGEVTNFTVPGGIVIFFSGRDVRHANGGKLQRLGLQPNVSAAPTIGGIRAGKDEVLEKALEYLSPKPPPKAPADHALRSRL